MKKILAMILLATLTLSACRTKPTQDILDSARVSTIHTTTPTQEASLSTITVTEETMIVVEPTEETTTEFTEQEFYSTEATELVPSQATENQQKQDTTPTEPATEPIPTESSVEEIEQPQPTQPVETSPVETEPLVVETIPVETEPPAETEPVETTPLSEEIDTTILAGYGVSYSCSTYGYESCPGLRDGFYPSYTCEFTTMEAGYAAVQGCVDDTTNTLLSRPGVQIVAEIDGVLCRARIDVTVTQVSAGVYEIAVYYG